MLIQVYRALRWSDTFRVLASVERSKPWSRLAVWRGQRPAMPLVLWCGESLTKPLGVLRG
ncbi:hypothetical protein [Paenibacillus sp. BR1-192]|uniref:hypothetical protein n=1 Tax=Paenibacillus sp. BR1-192 TaxID=3032287 RepID=UPI00240E4B57|nr:hypothetical protein [Paenibacillus sp. BR1-192]WFB56997.1 hypothetical protein P0X86_23890 [Paenibacillus sp. BR1-192]